MCTQERIPEKERTTNFGLKSKKNKKCNGTVGIIQILLSACRHANLDKEEKPLGDCLKPPHQEGIKREKNTLLPTYHYGGTVGLRVEDQRPRMRDEEGGKKGTWRDLHSSSFPQYRRNFQLVVVPGWASSKTWWTIVMGSPVPLAW